MSVSLWIVVDTNYFEELQSFPDETSANAYAAKLGNNDRYKVIRATIGEPEPTS